MKHSFWITLVVSASLCAVALRVQASRNKSLSERLVEAQAKAELPDPPARTATITPSAPEPEERIQRALADVTGAMAPWKERPENDARGVRQLPDVLRAVGDLNTDELIEVARGLPKSGTKEFLVELAAKQDPRKVYRDESLMEGMKELDKLGILARSDPAAALRALPPLKQNSLEASLRDTRNHELRARMRFSTMLLGVDVNQGLQALLEIHESDPAGNGRLPIGYDFPYETPVIGSPVLREETIPELIEATKNPGFAFMKRDLVEMTLNHTLFENGVEAAAERARAMDLTPQELDTYLDTFMRLEAVNAQPGAAVAWMAEASPKRIPSAVVAWAEVDLAGATDWLGAQEPSPMRDEAIAKFATKASELDREGAAKWAREIQDEKLRIETLRQVKGK